MGILPRNRVVATAMGPQFGWATSLARTAGCGHPLARQTLRPAGSQPRSLRGTPQDRLSAAPGTSQARARGFSSTFATHSAPRRRSTTQVGGRRCDPRERPHRTNPCNGQQRPVAVMPAVKEFHGRVLVARPFSSYQAGAEGGRRC